MKKPYSNALINCSASRKMISACPLAFGETGVKERVKGVLGYKKPAFWIVIAAVITCVLTAVCLLTNPKTYDADDLDDNLQVFLDTQIKAHHQSEQTDRNFGALDYDILKIDKSHSDITLYMWVYYAEYSNQNDTLQVEASAHTPTVVTVTQKAEQNKNGLLHYELKEYWEPRDGNLYKGDMQEKFPKALWAKVMDNESYRAKQETACRKMAEEYFNSEKEPEVIYQYQSDQDAAHLVLSPKDKQCSFSFSNLSSYIAVGTYEETNASLVMKTDDGNKKYTFQKEDGKLVFVAAQSSEMPEYAYSSDEKAKACVPDGAIFEAASASTIGGADQPTEIQAGSNPYFNAEVIKVNGNNIVVKPDEDFNEIKSADQISVSLDVISTIPVPTFKIGDRVRVVYNGEIAETDPAQINHVFAIYLLVEGSAQGLLNTEFYPVAARTHLFADHPTKQAIITNCHFSCFKTINV